MKKEVREGYKKTLAGYIPDEWGYEELNKLVNKITDGTHKTPNYTEDGIPFLRVTDIQQSNIDWGNVKYISQEEHLELIKRCNPELGDILYSKNGTIGIPKIIDWNKEFSIFVSLCLIKMKKENSLIINKYLEQFLKSDSCMRQIRLRAKQGTVTNLHLEEIRELVVPIPTKEEQEKIASILSTVDEQIDNTEKLIQKNQELKKGLMQQLLTNGIGHTKFKETEIGEIPEEWDVKKVGDICEVKGGKRLPKGYQLEDEDNAFPYIRVADMYMGGIRQDDIKYVPKDIVDKIKNYKISKDDLFISVAGTLGIVGQVPYELDGANLTENADKLCNIQINKLYLMKVLQSNIIQSIIEAEQTKSAQPKLALTRIKEFLIPVPSDIEQVMIASILVEVDEKIEEYENKKQKLEELKKGLMQQLLTGNIRVV